MVIKAGGFGSGGSGFDNEGSCAVCMGGRFVASRMVFAANSSGLKPPIKLLSCFATGSGSNRLLSVGFAPSAMASKAWTRS